MYQLNHRTRGNVSPQGKRKIYVTCHPEDVGRFLDKAIEGVLSIFDGAVYFKADMADPIPEEFLESDLGQMNLMVIPVSFRLLTTPNPAMDQEYPFAWNNHIPVLPLMMEMTINGCYQERFGAMHYLSP